MNITLNEIIQRRAEMNKLFNFRLIISYSSLALIIFGIIGNTTTFLFLRKSKNKHSTLVFLSALCIAANFALTGLLINHALYGIFIYYEYLEGINVIMFYYPYVYPFINTFQMASIWLTVSVSINQFIIVSRGKVKSFKKTKKTFKKELLTVLLVFILSSIYCIPYWMKFTYSPEYGIIVSEIGNDPIFIKVVHFYLYLPIAYIIPFTVLTISNTYLIITLKKKRDRKNTFDFTFRKSLTRYDSFRFSTKQRKSLKPDQNVNSEVCSLAGEIRNPSITNFPINDKKIKDTTFMLIAVVMFFLICHSPSLILHLIESFEITNLKKNIYYFYVMELAKFCLIFNLAFNFAIFYLFSRHFRKLIKINSFK